MQKYANIVPPCYEHYFAFCHDYVVACCAAQEKMDEAMEFALKIPTDRQAGKKTFFGALSQLQQTSNSLLQEDTRLEKDPKFSNIHLRCTRIAHERQPANLSLLINYGAAYCLAGNNVEGARCYRRALAAGPSRHGMDRNNFDKTKWNLVVAQLQCPRMPLEDKFVVSVKGNTLMCIQKSDRDKVAICNQEIGNQEVGTSLQVIDSGFTGILQYSMPADPNDPRAFSQNLIDLLESNISLEEYLNSS